MIQPLNSTPLPTAKPAAKRKPGKSKFLRSVTKPFPNSQKIHVEVAGSKVRVAMREVTQAQTKDFQGNMTENPALRIYDTSGPYTDPKRRSTFARGSSRSARSGSMRVAIPRLIRAAKYSRATTVISPPVMPNMPASVKPRAGSILSRA